VVVRLREKADRVGKEMASSLTPQQKKKVLDPCFLLVVCMVMCTCVFAQIIRESG
jgi:hypothetical protein